jgi:hypothetical protein
MLDQVLRRTLRELANIKDEKKRLAALKCAIEQPVKTRTVVREMVKKIVGQEKHFDVNMFVADSEHSS